MGNLNLPDFIHSPEPPALLFHDASRIYFSNSFFLAGGHSERWQAGLPHVTSTLSLCGPRSFVFNANSLVRIALLTVWLVAARRSEEHTSELQSLRHLVCRLLLEKKKQNM